MEPAKLTKLVRGELDWIVMKALEKDRNRRYETANGFAAGRAALPGGRAGAGVPADGGLPAAEVRAAAHAALAVAAAVAVLLAAATVGSVALASWRCASATAPRASGGRPRRTARAPSPRWSRC